VGEAPHLSERESSKENGGGSEHQCSEKGEGMNMDRHLWSREEIRNILRSIGASSVDHPPSFFAALHVVALAFGIVPQLPGEVVDSGDGIELQSKS